MRPPTGWKRSCWRTIRTHPGPTRDIQTPHIRPLVFLPEIRSSHIPLQQKGPPLLTAHSYAILSTTLPYAFRTPQKIVTSLTRLRGLHVAVFLILMLIK